MHTGELPMTIDPTKFRVIPNASANVLHGAVHASVEKKVAKARTE